MTFKRVTLLLNKIHNVLTFLPLIHVLNSKNPNAASDIWTPKQFKFPTFYLLRSGIQDKIVWPSWECSPSPLSSRRSCVECHEVFFRFLSYHEIFSANSNRIFSWANTPSASYLFTVGLCQLCLTCVGGGEQVCAQERGWGAKVNFYKRLESTSLKTLKSKQSKKVLRRSPKCPGVVHTVLILLPFGFCFFSLNVSR